MVGSLLGAAVAALAWLITLVAMAIDFTLFGVRPPKFINYFEISTLQHMLIPTL